MICERVRTMKLFLIVFGFWILMNNCEKIYFKTGFKLTQCDPGWSCVLDKNGNLLGKFDSDKIQGAWADEGTTLIKK